MNGYDAYRTYLAMKIHFTSESYDFVKSNGGIEASRDSFSKRKDRYFFEKIAGKRTNKDDLNRFMLANFLNDRSFWIGNPDAESIYFSWQGRYNSMDKLVGDDLTNIRDTMIEKGISFSDLTKVHLGRHPPLLKFAISEMVEIETSMILICGLKINEVWKKTELNNDAIYEAEELRLRKYSRFFNLPLMLKRFEAPILSCFKVNHI